MYMYFETIYLASSSISRFTSFCNVCTAEAKLVIFGCFCRHMTLNSPSNCSVSINVDSRPPAIQEILSVLILQALTFNHKINVCFRSHKCQLVLSLLFCARVRYSYDNTLLRHQVCRHLVLLSGDEWCPEPVPVCGADCRVSASSVPKHANRIAANNSIERW